MTAQVSEHLNYNGRDVALLSLPLGDYLALSGQSFDFQSPHTANWRGYLGSWELMLGRLYLTGISGRLSDGTQVALETLFPGFPERVFAHWFSGTLRIAEGEVVDYVHGGFASTFETEIFLLMDQGVVVGERIERHQRGERDA